MDKVWSSFQLKCTVLREFRVWGPDIMRIHRSHWIFAPVLALLALQRAEPVSGQSFTEFPIPTPNAFPQGITVGPDRALWFTEENANKIGRVTTAGDQIKFCRRNIEPGQRGLLRVLAVWKR
jgi:hypothetical protein